jgi:hypothetical protein
MCLPHTTHTTNGPKERGGISYNHSSPKNGPKGEAWSHDTISHVLPLKQRKLYPQFINAIHIECHKRMIIIET